MAVHTVNKMATFDGSSSYRSTVPDNQRTEHSALSGSRRWGKKAAQRLNTKKQFKNNLLLRTLEGNAPI